MAILQRIGKGLVVSLTALFLLLILWSGGVVINSLGGVTYIDGGATITVSFSADLNAHVKELRYLRFESDRNNIDRDELLETAERGVKTDERYVCVLPLSWKEEGLIIRHTRATVALPKSFSIWVLLDDGQWREHTVIVPARTQDKERTVIISEL